MSSEISSIYTLKQPFWARAHWQAIYWKSLSCASFAGINVIVRYLTKMCPAGVLGSELVIIFFQNLFGTLFILMSFIPKWIHLRKTNTAQLIQQPVRYPIYHALRIISAVVGVMLWYKSLKYIPITEALALNFTGPILTACGAWFILKEKFSPQRVLSVILSIMGAFIIARPDLVLNANNGFGWAVFLPIVSALLISSSKLFTRKLGALGESPQRLTRYLLVFMTPVSLVLAIPTWEMPSVHHWPWLILMGFLARLAHLSFAKAYALAEVTFLTPFGFLKFFLSALLGYMVFNEFPTTPTVWIGIAMVFISIAVLNYKMPLYSEAKRFKSS